MLGFIYSCKSWIIQIISICCDMWGRVYHYLVPTFLIISSVTRTFKPLRNRKSFLSNTVACSSIMKVVFSSLVTGHKNFRQFMYTENLLIVYLFNLISTFTIRARPARAITIIIIIKIKTAVSQCTLHYAFTLIVWSKFNVNWQLK